MSRVAVSYAETFENVFVGQKNFGLKLDPARWTGLKLEWDEDLKRLFVTWNGETKQYHNIHCHMEGEVKDRKIVQMGHPMVMGIGGAQVETPMSHVHAGHGHGKTGKAK